MRQAVVDGWVLATVERLLRPGGRASKSEVRRRFLQLRDGCGSHSVSDVQLSAAVRALGGRTRQVTGGARVWEGVQFRDEVASATVRADEVGELAIIEVALPASVIAWVQRRAAAERTTPGRVVAAILSAAEPRA